MHCGSIEDIEPRRQLFRSFEEHPANCVRLARLPPLIFFTSDFSRFNTRTRFHFSRSVVNPKVLIRAEAGARSTTRGGFLLPNEWRILGRQKKPLLVIGFPSNPFFNRLRRYEPGQ